MFPVLRPLQLHDLPSLSEIEQRCFSDDVRESPAVYRQRIETFPEGTLGFFIANELAGFFCSELWDEHREIDVQQFTLSHDIRSTHHSDGTLLYISSFAVDPLHRATLRGKDAFSLAMNHMQHTSCFHAAILLVAQSWHAARAIYEQWGFVELMRLPGSFPGDDGIIMQTSV